MITRQNWNSSEYVSIGSPPFVRSGGKKLPPVERANRPPLLAALKDISFLSTE